MKNLIEKYHARQIRNNNASTKYTEHLYGVASILESVAGLYDECRGQVLQDMLQAALGHDLLEDTDVTTDEIVIASSDRTLHLIQELTNPNDDAHTDEYMAQLSTASEEGRLVKYADLIENTTSFSYSLHEPGVDDPVQRAIDFYLPILDRTTAVLSNTSFTKYPQTAEEMRRILKVCSGLLGTAIAQNAR